jgi:hypothetical protein
LHDLGGYPNHCQLIVSIEVFEHLTDEQLTEYLTSIEADYLYLSSTPYATTPEFDEFWGHINLKQVDEWVEFMGKFGYSLYKRVDIPTPWSLIFKK